MKAHLSVPFEVEIDFELDININEGQRQINYPTDRAQEGISAYIEDVEVTADPKALESILKKINDNPEDYLDFDDLMEQLDKGDDGY